MTEDEKTIYDDISLKELEEIVEENKEKFVLIKIGWFDGWRWALYTKNTNYLIHVHKKIEMDINIVVNDGAIITARLLEKSDKEL